jgi:hypothetical protein
MGLRTTCLDKFGSENTERTLELVREWAERLDIETLLVASTTGKTGALRWTNSNHTGLQGIL